MGGFDWSTDQRQVIDARDENVLVAAAAGSGKTAVLVERIVNRITDGKNPIDIDRIVVVTFTKAAAAEMRERILKSIQDKLENMSESDPLYEHMCKQSVLIHNARITTIDSFCGYIVKNYFYEIELEPNYRIADEGENKLLCRDAIDELMEKEYASEDNELFIKLVDGYGDAKIREFIQQIYNRAATYPWPKEWLDKIAAVYDTDDFYKTDAIAKVIEIQKKYIRSVLEELETCLKESEENLELELFIPKFTSDIAQLKELLEHDGMDFVNAIDNVKFDRNPNSNEDLDEYTKYIDKRSKLKDAFNKKNKEFKKIFVGNLNEENELIKPYVLKLIELTKEFSAVLDGLKSQKNVYDFNDIEHFALNILRKADDPKHGITPTAEYLRGYYEEIMIDEYQDSNYLQEEILSSICRQESGKQNMFMVGDVKQSIYAFRQASPEIFTNKYQKYKADSSTGHAIDLSKNFRSRAEVLDGTNDVFGPLMQLDIGNVEYDDAAKLVYGNADYTVNDETAKRCEMEIIVGDYVADEADEMDVENSDAYDAQIIANKIKEMISSEMPVYDKDKKCERPITYSDIAILLRSPSTRAENYISILERNEISAHATSKSGYFSAPEVVYVLNILRVIDNPHQDVALVSVLKGPTWKVTDEELAMLKSQVSKFAKSDVGYMDFSDALWKLFGNLPDDKDKSATENLPDDLTKRLLDFYNFIEEMREIAKDVSVHELIQMIIRRTGYLHYVAALPRGENRRANLLKLVDQAVDYETTSYKGVFNFINYIEYCKKYDVDVAEAELVSENDDAVKIISIHKSKGLEYPVVFLAKCNTEFNLMDLNKKLIIHPELGFGLVYVDAERQIQYKPGYYTVVRNQLKEDVYGEEMRVLYVAMTRAREKLIITSIVGGKKSAENYVDSFDTGTTRMTYEQRMKSKCYMDWILHATQYMRDKYPVEIVKIDKAAEKLILDRGIIEKRRNNFEENVSDADDKLVDYIKEQYHHNYQFVKVVNYKTKYSVSEIKHQKMEEYELHENEEKQVSYAWGDNPLEDSIEDKIEALKKKNDNTVNLGAKRGTAVHRFMECYDFSDSTSDKEKAFNLQKDRIVDAGLMNADEMELVSKDGVVKFLESDTGSRMAAAEVNNKLYREQPFVMSAMPSEIWPDNEKNVEDDPVLIQGIIDVFFEEEDGIVLLDYKTDKVKSEEELVGRYRAQLNLYADAISRGRGKKVKEILIYSFCLDKTIML
ncbi:MAG: helicase-exonuclease AddAB subunit AddA [Lachnospiraceae bacterium]|nr:helicase-exonuclease AddAB subunit AddA [Lachnospiraceae bacterium]